MKAIITKYAMSSGIKVAEGKFDANDGRPMLVTKGSGFVSNDYFHGDDFQLTKNEAIARVEEMAAKLRASLIKRLANIDKVKAEALKQIEEADL
jgi:hypothetical protein